MFTRFSGRSRLETSPRGDDRSLSPFERMESERLHPGGGTRSSFRCDGAGQGFWGGDQEGRRVLFGSLDWGFHGVVHETLLTWRTDCFNGLRNIRRARQRARRGE